MIFGMKDNNIQSGACNLPQERLQYIVNFNC